MRRGCDESGYVQEGWVVGSRKSSRMLFLEKHLAGRYGHAWTNEYLYGSPDSLNTDDILDDHRQNETDV